MVEVTILNCTVGSPFYTVIVIYRLHLQNLPKTDTTPWFQDPDVMVQVVDKIFKAFLIFIQATITSKDSSLTRITKLVMNDNNPVFNQKLQMYVIMPNSNATSLANARPMLNLTVLDWDLTNHKRPIAEVQLPLAHTEGSVVTRRLDIKDCAGFLTCLVENL